MIYSFPSCLFQCMILLSLSIPIFLNFFSQNSFRHIVSDGQIQLILNQTNVFIWQFYYFNTFKYLKPQKKKKKKIRSKNNTLSRIMKSVLSFYNEWASIKLLFHMGIMVLFITGNFSFSQVTISK